MRSLFLFVYVFLTVTLPGSEHTANVIFIAGKDSHGHGEHEFRAGCYLLAKYLNKAGLGINATVIEDGWPQNSDKLKHANSVIVYSNGRKQHSLFGHFQEIDKLVSNGVGVGFLHDACNVITGEDSRYMTKWIGGFYEKGFSTNPKWECKAEINPGLTVSRGVKPFSIFDEWHFNINFENREAVKPVLSGTPDEAARSGVTSSPRGPFEHIVQAVGRKEILLWLKENEKGSRGFGFTGGHFHTNWKNKNFRTLVLNAIAWTAGVNIPNGGVPSKNPNNWELSYRMSPTPEEVTWSTEIKNIKTSKLVYKSPVIKGLNKKSAIHKEVDISGATELALMVLDGGNGINKDHCAWANPVLTFEDGTQKPLTDLNWEVGITGWREIKIDQGVENEKMVVNGMEVKGISTHALSIIRYKLPEKVKSFKVLMGLLDSNNGGGSVQFEIYTR